jgi:catechol 2,3-dioxygenase-like lactoylglutathione lyase family enzyme
MATRFDVIGIVVADMAASLSFYRRLGLPVPDGADGEPHVEVALPGGLRMTFDTQDTIRSFDPSWTPPSGGHGISLAFACDDPAAVDATHDELVAAGHRSHLAPWDAFWGQRYATVLDPDANAVDLFAPLPAPATS